MELIDLQWSTVPFIWNVNTHQRHCYSLFQVYQYIYYEFDICCNLWQLNSNWLEIDSASLCLWKGSAQLRGPGKKCSLGNHSSFPLLPPFWSCPEISERQTCTFYVLPPAKGQLQFSPSGREETMAAFTYFNCFHIHTCAMHKHPYMSCFSHTVKREGMLCTSFFLNATLICSQAKDILLYTM